MTTHHACTRSLNRGCPRSSAPRTDASTAVADTDRQVWIAGGVGVTPFLSWMRSLDGDLAQHVDFFYTAVGEAPFSQEIREIAARHPSLHAHLIDTAVDGRLSTEKILAAAGDVGGLSVFMCGPEGMLRAFQTGLEAAGVPSRRIHREYFDWR